MENTATYSSVQESMMAANIFRKQFGIENDGALFVNGRYFPLSDTYQNQILEVIQFHLGYIQQQVPYSLKLGVF